MLVAFPFLPDRYGDLPGSKWEHLPGFQIVNNGSCIAISWEDPWLCDVANLVQCLLPLSTRQEKGVSSFARTYPIITMKRGLVAIRAHNLAKSLVGKNAVVSGGTSGIGRAIAKRLAAAKVSVVVCGRSETAGESIVSEMKEVFPEGKHRFIKLDAAEVRNVEKFSEEFRKEYTSLHYLVITHGIATMQGRTETREGIDVKLALHYYSRVSMIRCLLPLLQATAGAGEDVRVLSVLSGGVHKPYTNWADLELRSSYSLVNAAHAAGFYNDLALDQLARDNPQLTFIHAAPGAVRTAIGGDFPALLRGPLRVLQMFFKSPEDCAENMCFGLFADEHKGGFRLLAADGSAATATKEHTEDARKKVWDHTVEVLDRAHRVAS
eukprot:jgi/Mesvir1/530/Mv11391-RA.1